MQSISSQLDKHFRAAMREALGFDADAQVSVAQNTRFGDYQSNAAMGLARVVGERTGQKANPRGIAEQIVAQLRLGEMASEVSIAGPGFINVRLAPGWLAARMGELAADARVGVAAAAAPQTIVVDYSGPNIAKELHVGHLRSTIIGDSIARVLDFLGHRVIRQNHIGDWGTQFGKVILAIWYIAYAKGREGGMAWLSKLAGDMAAAQRTVRRAMERAKALPPSDPARAVADAEAAEAQARVGALVEALREQHEADYKSDPQGDRRFARFLKEYRPDLDELLPIYQMVSIFDESPDAQKLEVTATSASGAPERRPLASLPRLITMMLQRASHRDRQELNAWWKVREATLDHCNEIYEQLGVLLSRLDEYGESRYNPLLPRIVAELREKGIAVESQGAVAVFIDGPDKPPLVIEKAGREGYLYGTTDLAAVWYRVMALRAARVVYLVDARQSNHFNQVFATARKAGWAAAETGLEHAAFGTMLGEDNKPFKTRSGDTVKLKDLLAESEERALALVRQKSPELPEEGQLSIAHAVGIGAVKYSDLSKDRISDYVFSFEKALAMDGNTAPYLQYANARIQSIFRKAETTPEAAIAQGAGAILLDSPQELALAKHLLRLGDVVELVARELKPHHLCNHLYELATLFSGFFENCPVLQSAPEVRTSRLALCALVARTMRTGLDLLGIEHPTRM